ncbi:glycosyltransferase [Stenomitos frigidus]|uniref:Glycosyltransferase n=1 Tax=Stenomitos frigidus AS-A4 TaxID=2933935 RepID=A0ABV0KLU1_9CYAN
MSEIYLKNNRVGWAVNHTLETILADVCETTFLYPSSNKKIGLFKRYRHRLFKSWYELKDLPTLGNGPNVLLAVGMTPFFLLSMHTLRPLLKQFDLRVAYLLDSFEPNHIDRSIVADLDHLFVIDAEAAAEINSTFPIATTFLPLATDALRLGSNARQRPIDIINYGRTNLELHKCLQSYYSQPCSERLYYHSTFNSSIVHDLGEHITLHSKLLSRSRISLCFEPSQIDRFCGRSPILFRWFEGWAGGCTIVGKRPLSKGVASLMDWEDSTIELPDEASEWVPFLEGLLNDDQFLTANSQRNSLECLLRHDWRYRLKDMFNVLALPLSEQLKAELLALQQKIEQQKKDC